MPRFGVSGAVAASAGGAPSGVLMAGGRAAGSPPGIAAGGAGAVDTSEGDAPNPSIVLLKSACRGAAAEPGGRLSGGAASALGAAADVADGAVVDGGGVPTATCIIVRVRGRGAEVNAPHSPQNWAVSGSEWPHWVQVRVFIEPVRLGVAV